MSTPILSTSIRSTSIRSTPIPPAAVSASLTAASSANKASPSNNSSKIANAAQQFEALMIGQMLRSVHEESQDADSDTTGETMHDLANQHFSQLLAKNGGLGLAQMIVKGLNHEDRQQRTQSNAVAQPNGSDRPGVR